MKTNRMCALIGNVARYDGLLPLTESRPLDTLPFDCKYRLIDFPLSSVMNANINHIFMVFNEGETRSVYDHLGGGKEWNLDALQNRFFIYFYQEFTKKKAQGLPYFETVIDYLEKSESEYTVFMGSRMLCNIDLRSVLQTHKKQKADLTVAYKKVSSHEVGEKDVLLTLQDSNQAIGYELSGQVASTTEEIFNLGMDIFIAKTDWLIQELKNGQENNAPASMQEFLRSKIGKVSTAVHEYTGYLSNIHDLKSYYQANMDMLDANKFSSLLYTKQKIYTKLKNEAPTHYTEHSVVNNSQCASGCEIKGLVENSLISRRTVIEEQAEVKDAIIMASAQIGEGARIRYAILDKNVEVKPGITIQGTPEKPVVVKKNQVVTADIIEEA
jgi:glucose-1-phosphate adenylyltransferase